MNSHLNKEIFSETGCINKEILLRYRDGKMRDAEKHEVEKHLVDCPLCTEALEGFALLGGTASFDEVNERLADLSKTGSTFNFSRYVAVAASVAAVVTLTYFAFKQFDDVKTERLATSETVLSDDTVLQETHGNAEEAVLQPHSDTVIPIVNENKNAVVVSEQSDASANQRQLAATSGNVAAADVQVVEPIQTDDAVAMTETPAEAASEEVTTLSTASVPVAAGYTSNISYVDNRKIIDYSAVSKDKETVSGKSEKSVPSKYENQLKKAEVEKDETQSGIETQRKITYRQLITEPIQLYNDGKYAAAIKKFDEVLAINQSDENARFYKGMSLYHLKKYNEAISLLKSLSSINTQPFSEEALFYVAKSHAALDENQQAIAIFRSIVAKKGFYAEKARVELKKLE